MFCTSQLAAPSVPQPCRTAGQFAVIRSSSCRWLDGDPGDGRETLGGYEQGGQGPGQHSSAELLAGTRRSVIRLEMRDSCDPAVKGCAEWRAAGGTGAYERGDHLGVVRAAVARGVRIRRVRVVSGPLPEYPRWERAVRDQVPGCAVNSWCCAARPAAGRTGLAITACTSAQSRSPPPARTCPPALPPPGCRAGTAWEPARVPTLRCPVSAAVNPVGVRRRPGQPAPGRRSERRSHRVQGGTPEKSRSFSPNGPGACPGPGCCAAPAWPPWSAPWTPGPSWTARDPRWPGQHIQE